MREGLSQTYSIGHDKGFDGISFSELRSKDNFQFVLEPDC